MKNGIGGVDFHIESLESMKRYPKELWYIGNLSLLQRPKVSIVGTRRPSAYTKKLTMELASALSARGVVVVSGAAMGVDALAHKGAGHSNTIAVVANGLDIRYPSVNGELIAGIERDGLVMSMFGEGKRAASWSFVVRNEMVVALGEILVIAEADEDSGSMSSAKYALQMEKEIFVFPQRLYESSGTNGLLERGEASAIYDIERFASRFGSPVSADTVLDEFFFFCQKNPTIDEAVTIFGERVYEEELEGRIVVENGRIRPA